MFYDKTTDRQAKYALRKKKNGGGAASFLIGTVVLGGLMLGGATNAQADTNATNAPTQGADDTAKTTDRTTGLSAVTTTLRRTSTASSGVDSVNAQSTPTPTPTSGTVNNQDVAQQNTLQGPATTAETKDQNINQKVKITNVTFDKDVIKESEGTDLTITFDWKATGLHKGDTMVTPMFEGFDSISNAEYTINSDTLANMGSLLLDYDDHKIYAKFTGDIDPDTLYKGKLTIGTYVSRNYFKNLENQTTVKVPLPNGTVVEKPLKVSFDQASSYDAFYVAATKEVMSADKTQADVSWAVLLNPKQQEMFQPTLYLSPNSMDATKDYYGEINVEYQTRNTPYTLDPSSIKVYEAEISPSLGYTKGKQLEPGKNYEITEGDYSELDGKYQKVNNVWIIKLLGDYSDTKKQFAVEYNTHHDHLDPNISSGDRDTPVDTDVYADAFFDNGHANDFPIVTGKINLIDSSMTMTGEEKCGSVDVKYITKDGKVLEDVTSVKDNAPVGEEYKTEQKTFDGYHFVEMGKTSAPATGVVAEGPKHVIYVYEKDATPEVKKGSVDVKYVTADGKVLADTTTVKDNVPVGENYTTEQKTFDGYHFVGMDKTSDPANGKVTEGTKHVIYIYEKDPVAQTGNVDVQYITYVDGKAVELPGGERTPLFTTDQAVDTPYTTNVRNFDNYHFVGMDQSSAAATGKVTNGVQHVIYVYEKNVTPTVQRGSVDVIYVDEHGNPLPGGELTTVKSNEPVGTSYTTTQREFEGYTFTRMGTGSATPSGTVVPGVSHVIYVYTKDEPLPTPKPGIEGGTVTVTYVDEHGNPLPGGEETPVKDHAPVGETYTTTQRDFPGYTFTGMGEGSATPTGIVVPGTTRVVYVYTKTPTPTTETPTTPTTSTTPTPTASTPVAPAPVTPVAPSQPTAPASAKLPQTGNQANDSTAALGLAGLGLSALAALGLRKKKNS